MDVRFSAIKAQPKAESASQNPAEIKQPQNPAEKLNNDDDILAKPPVRWLAYSNGIGESFLTAMGKGVGPYPYVLAYVPALLYTGADIYDKYKKGEEGNYTKPSVNKFISQSVYQAFASFALTIIPSKGGSIAGGKILNNEWVNKNILKGKFTPKQKALMQPLFGLVGLALTAKHIDNFTRKFIVNTALEPMLYEDKKQEFMNKYIRKNEFLSGLVKSSESGK